MMQTGEFAYTANDYFAIAELPYGNEAFSMIVLLPREGVIMDKALEGFTLDNWNRWLSGLSSSKSNLTVVLPKFIFKYEKDLIPPFRPWEWSCLSWKEQPISGTCPR
jgi:serpin B